MGHRLADGQILQTLYAGLSSITVRVGERVARDEILGTLESELYFEIRKGAGVDIHSETIAGKTLNTPDSKAPNRIDPDSFFKDYPNPPSAPDAFTIIRRKELARRKFT